MIEQVTISLDKERKLLYDFNAQIQFEKATRSVHVCPKCQGAKVIKNPDNNKFMPCPVCGSRGFVDVFVNTLTEDPMVRVTSEYIRALLWACLLADDPDIKIADVSKMVSMHNFLDIHAALKKAIESAMPEPSKKKAKNSRNG